MPLIDTVFAVIRRARHRTGVATADKAHLHHRLMDLGHGHRRTVVILWAWTALLSGFVLVPVFTSRGNGIVPIGLAAFALMLFTLFAPSILRRRGSDRHDDAGGPGHTPSPGDGDGDPTARRTRRTMPDGLDRWRRRSAGPDGGSADGGQCRCRHLNAGSIPAPGAG